MAAKQIIKIDGSKFSTLEEFYAHFSERALNGYPVNNLDAFNDVLRGGFGTPEDGFILVWENHAQSKASLGYEETIRQLRIRKERCHPDNVQYVEEDIQEAEKGVGETVFDWLVEIIQEHCARGSEESDDIELRLE